MSETFVHRPGIGWACVVCGAVVSTRDWDLHDAWHARGAS